jgi:hypothetical protein
MAKQYIDCKNKQCVIDGFPVIKRMYENAPDERWKELYRPRYEIARENMIDWGYDPDSF